jgi:hypothetical protein
MAIRCDEEFNPWPSFVDIFSSVILVLLLFLLVTIVNIGYYAQFKFKVQYTGSVVTDDIILQDTAKKVQIEEKKKFEVKKKRIIVKHHTEDDPMVPQKQVELQAATSVESAGEDLADKKKADTKSPEKIIKSDKLFYITYQDTELFIGQDIVDKLKEFLLTARKKYPNQKISLSATDPLDQISLTVTKQITLGRTLSIKSLLLKFKYTKKDIKLNLSNPPKLPDEIDLTHGVVIVQVVPQ